MAEMPRFRTLCLTHQPLAEAVVASFVLLYMCYEGLLVIRVLHNHCSYIIKWFFHLNDWTFSLKTIAGMGIDTARDGLKLTVTQTQLLEKFV